MKTKVERFLLGKFRTAVTLITIFCLISLPATSNSANFHGIFAKGSLKRSIFLDNLIDEFVVFSNTGSITITDHPTGAGSPNGTSVPYPSNISVSGLSGTVSSLTVTLNGVTMPRPRENDFVLVGPTGQAFMLMSDCGDLTATSAINLTFSDAAAAAVPTGASSVIPSGTFKPTDFGSAVAGNDTFPAPGPATINLPVPAGASTFASVFAGTNPNGTWSLYIIDDAIGGGNGAVAGGWSLDITTNAAAAATTTTIGSSLNPSFTNQAVTFTATVTSGGNPVNVSTVDFTDGATVLASNVALNGSGQAAFTAPANTLNERVHTITATFDATAAFATSNASLSQTVNSPTVQTGAQFCNNGGFAGTDNTIATPYPSNLFVSGLVGTISKVTVDLNNLNTPRPRDIDVLLVGPTTNLLLVSDVGDLTAASGINWVIDDAGGTAIPSGSGSIITSGTFRPTDAALGGGDNFPAPAPAISNIPAPAGSATLGVFNGSNPNGTWNLYFLDDSIGGGNHAMGSWCVDLTLAPLATTTTVGSSQNPSVSGSSVTFTATVSATGATPTGNVTFFDGATIIGNGTLTPSLSEGKSPEASSTATFTTSSLSVGSHNITAQYAGVSGTGGGGLTSSTSTILTQQVNASNVMAGGRVTAANGRGIPNAVVTVTGPGGFRQTALTSSFGYYSFFNLTVNQTYTFSVTAKRYTFVPPSVVRLITSEVNDIHFVGTQ